MRPSFCKLPIETIKIIQKGNIILFIVSRKHIMSQKNLEYEKLEFRKNNHVFVTIWHFLAPYELRTLHSNFFQSLDPPIPTLGGSLWVQMQILWKSLKARGIRTSGTSRRFIWNEKWAWNLHRFEISARPLRDRKLQSKNSVLRNSRRPWGHGDRIF